MRRYIGGGLSLGHYIPGIHMAPRLRCPPLASGQRRGETLHQTRCEDLVSPRLEAGAAGDAWGRLWNPAPAAVPHRTSFLALLRDRQISHWPNAIWKTTPYVSWMITLIGDPLYNPYRAHSRSIWQILVDALQGETEP